MSLKDQFNEEVDTLRTMRDELALQIHLGAAEARERWEGLEKQWEHLEGRVRVIADAGQESLEEIEEAGRKLLDEIRDGYKSLRKLL